MPWTKLQADNIALKQAEEFQENGRQLTYRQSLLEAHSQALQTDPRVFIMGEGVDDPGGIFGTTLGLHKKFGPNRVFDLPIAENGCTGVAIGAAIAGMRPILVHMRMDFLLVSMDQIVNHAAKWRYMFGGRQHVPLVIRCIIGRGWGSAAQHSQSLQGLFVHVPGLKVVIPSNAYDAKGLLLMSIADNDPVLFIEHRWLYNHRNYVPEEMYFIPLGEGAIKRTGKDITIVAISHMVFEALEAAKQLHREEGIDVEVIDPRSLKPLDEDIILDSVKKTGRLLIADTGNKMGGVSGEIAAIVLEKAFSYLKSPLIRVGLPDVPTPASPALEKVFYPDKNAIIETVKRAVSY